MTRSLEFCITTKELGFQERLKWGLWVSEDLQHLVEEMPGVGWEVSLSLAVDLRLGQNAYCYLAKQKSTLVRLPIGVLRLNFDFYKMPISFTGASSSAQKSTAFALFF